MSQTFHVRIANAKNFIKGGPKIEIRSLEDLQNLAAQFDQYRLTLYFNSNKDITVIQIYDDE